MVLKNNSFFQSIKLLTLSNYFVLLFSYVHLFIFFQLFIYLNSTPHFAPLLLYVPYFILTLNLKEIHFLLLT